MAEEMTLFDVPQDGTCGFEELGQENGHHFWWRSDLQRALGYSTVQSFDKPIAKAMAACAAIGIPIPENFDSCQRDVDGVLEDDCKLSRFACYLTAMNSDPRKPAVAQAQAYFAGLAEITQEYRITDPDHVERVLMRDEMVDREKSLSGVAFSAGVNAYGLFQNAGYRGLYNMDLRRLKVRKGIDDGRSLLDFMGREELAANLFRITQTEGKIRKERVKGQRALENTAEGVGREVRQTIAKIGGTMPEVLPVSQDIKKVRSGLKQTSREFRKIDTQKRLPQPRIKPRSETEGE